VISIFLGIFNVGRLADIHLSGLVMLWWQLLSNPLSTGKELGFWDVCGSLTRVAAQIDF
jgi:hypothetical protein